MGAMKICPKTRSLPLLLLASAPLLQAHPGHGPADFSTGFLHPLTGWDHLLAMVAVGLWAAQLGSRSRWGVPAAFLGAMILGALAGIGGFAPIGMEAGIAASVLILGLLVAGAVKLPIGYGIGIAALAGAFHGAAHGAEMPRTGAALSFLGGMVVATALLHAAGVTAGSAAGAGRKQALVRWAGAGIAAAGVALLAAA